MEIEDDCFVRVNTLWDHRNRAEVQENTDLEEDMNDMFTLEEIASQIHAAE